jgi:hypothetical protein
MESDFRDTGNNLIVVSLKNKISTFKGWRIRVLAQESFQRRGVSERGCTCHQIVTHSDY